MGEAYLFGTGGGSNLKNAYAIISVLYPQGASCTCSLDGKTYKAGNTYGAWAFGVNGDGDWTLTISDEEKGMEKTYTVTVSGEGTGYYIDLRFDFVFYNRGTRYTEQTGSLTKTQSGSTVTYNTNYLSLKSHATGTNWSYYYWATPIDLTPYKTLYIEGSFTHHDSNYGSLRIINTSSTTSVKSVGVGSGTRTVKLDISDLNAPYRIEFGHAGYQTSYASCNITKWWME